MTHTIEQDERDRDRHPVRVEVTVNMQQVILTAHRLTGLQIKQEAIAHGVAIQADFQLSVKDGHRFRVVGDTDEIEVHEHQEFLAVAPDDNS